MERQTISNIVDIDVLFWIFLVSMLLIEMVCIVEGVLFYSLGIG